MAFLKFLQWNSLFIVTDMVASVITRNPFTVLSVLREWFWWNVAYYLILAVIIPFRGVFRRLYRRVQWQRKR